MTVLYGASGSEGLNKTYTESIAALEAAKIAYQEAEIAVTGTNETRYAVVNRTILSNEILTASNKDEIQTQIELSLDASNWNGYYGSLQTDFEDAVATLEEKETEWYQNWRAVNLMRQEIAARNNSQELDRL